MDKDTQNYLIDVASTQELGTPEDDKLKDIIKDNYDFLAPYIDNLYYIEANIIYLSYVQGVSQAVIGKIFNMTQYGVSKRLVSALKRLSIFMSIPNSDTADNYDFLRKIIPQNDATAIVVFYSLKTIHTVSRVVRASSVTITKTLNRNIKFLTELQSISDPISFKKKILEIKPSLEVEDDFMEQLSNEQGFFLVVRHTITLHINYIKALKDYNSRGSHSFRKEWH